MVDRPGGDGSGTCTNDDGMRNKLKGQACTCDLQCSSGFCADGYCCDKACAGTCMSCGLPTSLGTCTATPAGVKPRALTQCPAAEVGSCGLDGTCDGTGKCRNYEAGSICNPGKCDGDAVTNNFACDGAGSCKLAAATICAPFSCNTATMPNSCFGTCASDADCVSGRKCSAGSCGKKMNGALCPKGDVDCASGHCADGVCCNTTCGGACRSCNLVGFLGTCSPVSAGKGHPLCTQQAAMTCGTTGVCDGFGTCSIYPSTTLCGGSSCVNATSMNTARSCDGLGSCQPSMVQPCGKYRCANGACNSKCASDADCADGVACVNGSCGPKLDGQTCAANSDCQSQQCVDGVCCNTACTGACRSCNLAGSMGKCTVSASGAADPRAMCKDMGPATCGTNGKCDGTGICQKYAAGTTVCAVETCVSDVYTGPSTCNASGQCIKPNASACFPYHCNATKCFSACTTSADCITPNICGMNGMISSCGLKPNGGACSAATECASGFCAQGVCCNNSCSNACQACNLAGTTGSCTNINGGVDPQGKCAVTAATTCGTTGLCSNGNCSRWGAGTQCIAASCPTASTRTPAGMCSGGGTCVPSATTNCAPGRCTAGACVNTCTTSADCTAPATCVAGSCGLQPKGGACTATSMCAAGLTCYLAEGANGVCCDTACSGTCESCNLAGTVGTCTAVPAGAADPDPATACVAATDPRTCGLNGRCAGTNTATNGTGTARCQFYGNTQGCRNLSCADSAGGASMVTLAANCTGTGTCAPVTTQICGGGSYKCLDATQCRNTCTSDAQCVGAGVTCVLNHCGSKQGPGALCNAGADCASGNCVDGVCCSVTACNDNNACNGVEMCGPSGTCVASTGPIVDDGNPCTVDSCDMTTGVVSHLAASPSTVCRAAVGPCDVAETCAGTSCPADGLASSATVCRASAGACDMPENCSGTSPGCPSDALRSSGSVCRAAAGMCDAAETCSGASAACPADSFISGGVCRVSAGPCDVAESCSGAGAACPADAFASSGVCRPAAGECDVADMCSGSGAACPADEKAPDTTPCNAGLGMCTAGTCI